MNRRKALIVGDDAALGRPIERNDVVSRKKRLLAVAVAVAAGVMIAGCAPSGGSGGSSTPGGTYHVWMSLGVTGGVATVAKANVAGMQAAIDAVNDDGGIDGKKVELSVSDDQLDPTKAVTNLQTELQSHKIDLAIAGNTSNVANALAPVLSRDKILAFTQASAVELNDPSKFPYLFQSTVLEPYNVSSMLSEIESKGYKKIALLVANDALGQSTAAEYKKQTAAGGFTLSTETFAPTDLDMTAQLQRLQASDPDVLVINAFGSVLGYILKGRTALGWDVPTIGANATANGNNLGALSTPADWTNMSLQAIYVNTEEGASTSAAKDFVARLKKNGAALDVPLHQYAVFWDILHIVKAAVEKAHSTDAPAVAKAIVGLGKVSPDTGATLTFAVERYTEKEHAWTWTDDELQSGKVLKYVGAGPIEDGVIKSAH